MNNKYLYIGDNKIAGPLEKKKPMFSAWDMMANDATGQADRKIKEFETYIASLPKIEVVKEPTHSWEINQVLVNGKDFEFVYATGDGDGGEIIYKGDPCYPSDIKLAMPFRPISKPNTDVKQDQKQHLKDIMEADEKDGLYDNPEK